MSGTTGGGASETARKRADAPLRDDCFAQAPSLPPGVDWTPVDEALAGLRATVEPVTAVETVAICLKHMYIQI
ncbi:MAG: hypothetical protein AAF899_18825 [Pseudomonadota bacterium]